MIKFYLLRLAHALQSWYKATPIFVNTKICGFNRMCEIALAVYVNRTRP